MNTEDEALQRDILATGKPKEIFEFARMHPDADIAALQQRLLTNFPKADPYQPQWHYGFAKHIPGADKQAIYHAISWEGRRIDTLLRLWAMDPHRDDDAMRKYLEENDRSQDRRFLALFNTETDRRSKYQPSFNPILDPPEQTRNKESDRGR